MDEKDPRVLFGKRLRLLRKQIGLSQEKLALKAEIDRAYVGNVERGQKNISLLNICKLAQALEVSPDQLLDFSSLQHKN